MRWCIIPFAIAGLAACEPAHPITGLYVDPGASKRVDVREAVAVLQPTAGNRVTGVVELREAKGGVDVVASIDGLPPGRHAHHVHVFGDCSSADAKSAGPHFHFRGSSFDESVRIITGNLGDLESSGVRTTKHQARVPAATLQGRYSLVGRSVVIHAKPNDHSHPPDGNAGDRLACGVIGVKSVAKPSR